MNSSIIRPLFILGFGIGLGSTASTALRIESVRATPKQFQHLILANRWHHSSKVYLEPS